MSSNNPQVLADFHIGDFHVNELAADKAGSLSPFGQDIEFPLPLSKITYKHPRPEDRPRLANGR
ncbi:MAG TPA: hypothetical protein VGL26_04195 [Jatrophihabitans sp.]|jgi:hypothetical protein